MSQPMGGRQGRQRRTEQSAAGRCTVAMMKLAAFLGTTLAYVVDPLLLLGIVVSTYFVRDWRVMLAIGGAWGIAIEILVSVLNPGHGMRTTIERIVAGLIIALIAWGIAHLVRRNRAPVNGT